MTTHDVKVLIERCVKEDPDARLEFQQQYAAVIYSFPIRIFHLSEEEAGDFYLYVFEQGRIFRRVQSFEGKNAIQFETYLSSYVLRDLCLEWMRTTERVDVVSPDMPVTGAEATNGRSPCRMSSQRRIPPQKPSW